MPLHRAPAPAHKVETFIVSGNYRKDSRAKMIEIIVGGAGGGGAGALNNPGDGGGYAAPGGGGGSIVRTLLLAASVPDEVAITIGAGGAGGPGRTDSSSGTNRGLAGILEKCAK